LRDSDYPPALCRFPHKFEHEKKKKEKGNK
jgi:hypothetical protein